MFRFSIRELMLVTLVVALVVGWWLDHRHFAGKANYYMEVYRQWRERVEGIDSMLTHLGFEIREEDFSKSYTFPSCLREKVSPATGRFEVPKSENTPEALYPLSPAFIPDYESEWWQKP
jgi:hypothetical protein